MNKYILKIILILLCANSAFALPGQVPCRTVIANPYTGEFATKYSKNYLCFRRKSAAIKAGFLPFNSNQGENTPTETISELNGQGSGLSAPITISDPSKPVKVDLKYFGNSFIIINVVNLNQQYQYRLFYHRGAITSGTTLYVATPGTYQLDVDAFGETAWSLKITAPTN